MLVDIDSLPRVVDPDVSDSLGSGVTGGEHLVRELALLGLVLVVENEDAELGLGGGGTVTHALAGNLNVLLELLDGVLEGCSGVVDLINNEDSLSDEVLHLAESGQVEPLCSGDLGTGGLDFIVAKRFVEGETDGLDGDVGSAALLEERSEDSSRDVTTTTDGDQKLGLEVGEELLSGLLAHLVHIVVCDVELLDHFGGYFIEIVGYISNVARHGIYEYTEE